MVLMLVWPSSGTPSGPGGRLGQELHPRTSLPRRGLNSQAPTTLPSSCPRIIPNAARITKAKPRSAQPAANSVARYRSREEAIEGCDPQESDKGERVDQSCTTSSICHPRRKSDRETS